MAHRILLPNGQEIRDRRVTKEKRYREAQIIGCKAKLSTHPGSENDGWYRCGITEMGEGTHFCFDCGGEYPKLKEE